MIEKKMDIRNPRKLKIGDVLIKSLSLDNGMVLIGQGTVITQEELDSLERIEECHCTVIRQIFDEDDENFHKIEEIYNEELESINHLMERIANDVTELTQEEIVSTCKEVLKKREVFALDYMYYLNNAEEYLSAHSAEVMVLSYAIAKDMRKSEDEAMEIGLAGFLHDVGYCNVPGDIMAKDWKATEEEKNIKRRHTNYGFDILCKNNELSELVKETALKHHELPNGEGYPLGLDSNAIPEYVRIVSLSNRYANYTSPRHKQTQIDPFTALKIIWEEYGKEWIAVLWSLTKIIAYRFSGSRIEIEDLRSGHPTIKTGTVVVTQTAFLNYIDPTIILDDKTEVKLFREKGIRVIKFMR